MVVAHGVDASGGQEAVTARIVQYLLEHEWRVDVIAQRVSLAPSPLLRVFRVPVPRRPAALTFPLFWAMSTPLVWALSRRGAVVLSAGPITGARSDATCAHFCHRAFRALSRESRASKSSVLYRLNALLDTYMHLGAERFTYAWNRTGVCVAVSTGVAAEIRNSYPSWTGSTVVIANGVDVDDRSAPVRDTSPLSACFVGGDWHRKGLQAVIEALVSSRDWRLVVAGRGDESRFRELARSLGVEERVDFLGQVQDVQALYLRSHAFVLASAYETFSLAAHEAAAAGLPLVSTPVSGVVDLFERGDVGCLVDSEPSSIAKALTELHDAETRDRKGTTAKRLVSNMSWSGQLSRYDDVLTGLLDQGSGR